MPLTAPGAGSAARLGSFAALTLVVVGSLLLLLPGLGRGSLQGDEAIYGAVALDSAASGRTLSLELDGKPYVNKPPLLFWSMRFAFALLGATPLAARLAGALAGLALALWIARAGAARAAIGASGAWAGAFAALLVLSTPTALGIAGDRGFRDVCTDGLLTLAVVVAIGFWGRWFHGGRRLDLASCALAVVAGALAKGYLAPLWLLLGIVAGSNPPAAGPRAPGRRARWLGATLAVGAGMAATAAWLVSLEASGAPRVWRRVVLRNTLERVAGAVDPVHLQGPAYYLRSIGEDFGLWLLLLVPALVAWKMPAGRDGARTSRARRLDLLLPLLALALFSLAATKLRWYLLPAYPFLALALAAGATELWGRARPRPLRFALGALLTLALSLRLVGAIRELRMDPPPPAAPLLAELAPEGERRLERIYLDSRLGFGAPAGGLTAEEYFFVGGLPNVTRALPASAIAESGCVGLLAADADRLRRVPGLGASSLRAIGRSRADVGPLWLAVSCRPVS